MFSHARRNTVFEAFQKRMKQKSTIFVTRDLRTDFIELLCNKNFVSQAFA